MTPAKGKFRPGEAYVAFSRVRTLLQRTSTYKRSFTHEGNYVVNHITEIIKFYDVCQCMNMTILQKGLETIHPIPGPLKERARLAWICLVH